jgi:hypothetical protein
LGVRSTIIGHDGRGATPLRRALAWIALISCTTVSSVSAISRCIVAGSSPSRK